MAIMTEPRLCKTYVRQDNTAVLTCPHCGAQKTISADSFRGRKHQLTVKCSCRQTFKAFLEFRHKVRKKTFLRGTYINHTQRGKKCDLVILDISVRGLTFTSLDAATPEVGDELSIEFTLDDEHKTDVRRDAIVKYVRRSSVGCEFEIPGDAFDGPLGYYVMS